MESGAGAVIRVDENAVARSEVRIGPVEREAEVEILVVVRHVDPAEVGAGGRLRGIAVGDRHARPVAERAVDGDALERAGLGGNNETGEPEGAKNTVRK